MYIYAYIEELRSYVGKIWCETDPNWMRSCYLFRRASPQSHCYIIDGIDAIPSPSIFRDIILVIETF